MNKQDVFNKIADVIMEIENQLANTTKANYITNHLYIDFNKHVFEDLDNDYQVVSYLDVIIDLENQLERDLKNTINVFDREKYIECLDNIYEKIK